jgi:hypothetical protein
MSLREHLTGAAAKIGDLAHQAADKVATVAETVEAKAGKLADDAKAEFAKIAEITRDTRAYAVVVPYEGVSIVGLYSSLSKAELAATKANEIMLQGFLSDNNDSSATGEKLDELFTDMVDLSDIRGFEIIEKHIWGQKGVVTYTADTKITVFEARPVTVKG